METGLYRTPDGAPVTAVTADEMRLVDRAAVDAGLTLPRMMEHAGRSLTRQALELRRGDDPAVVLAGGGGNGGGGMVCARHLANKDVTTYVALDRTTEDVSGVPAEQLRILRQTDAEVVVGTDELPSKQSIVVDAVLGYGLQGAPEGTAAHLIGWIENSDAPVVSLDLPSGVDATTGETPGEAVEPALTVTLALPKTGLATVSNEPVLADLSIPTKVYSELGIPYSNPFGNGFTTPLNRE